MRTLAVLTSLLILTTSAWSQTESEKLHQLLDDAWQYSLENAPEFATYVGDPRYNDQWNDRSMESVERWQQHDRDLLAGLDTIDRSALSPADQLTYDLYRKNVESAIEGHRFPDPYMPINQLRGIQQGVASLMNRMPAQTVADYENIIARLRTSDAPIRQTISRMQWGLELDVTPPAITLRDVPDQIAAQIVDDPTASPAYDPFKDFPTGISDAEAERLRAEAAEAIRGTLVPAYREMHSFFTQDYLPRARDAIAISSLPDGEAWYRYNIRRITTTDLSPQEIHDIGLREVARIRAEMDRVIRESGFEGSFEEFSVFMRDDPQFYFTEKEDLLIAYRDIAKRIDPELSKLFGTLPRNQYGILPVPEYAEQSQTTAYYQPGSPQAGRAGYFFANTYALDTRPKWEMEALTLHEAMPGHHLQISIAQELENVPAFRQFTFYTAFVEGWGLYAESLGEELGMYKDPYSKYGQLTYEMWRAIRLVVDTGMHALGWSRQDAIDFFARNSSKQLHDITVEVDRYIVWPGQALAYKLGELKFKELRARAEEALGEDFDIRSFHDALLEQGALPLDLVERHIDDWIESVRLSSDAG